ncbi:MAG: type II toxin-antitoxin system RelE/ParE family toxin [Nitrospinae bacterium]|nr:type II toxin-antitoxin system RelE/ParE family toxin [Nitrospinota bacterium]
MIRSFKDKNTRSIFERDVVRRFQKNISQRAFVKLIMIDAAERIEDLRLPPGNRLEALVGSRKGQHSIRINDKWRVCFRWEGGDAFDVEICDYH